jgi:hypothetical protein
MLGGLQASSEQCTEIGMPAGTLIFQYGVRLKNLAYARAAQNSLSPSVSCINEDYKVYRKYR